MAQHDLNEIFDYVSNELCNTSAALSLIDEFEKAFDRICVFPESCALVDNEYVKDSTLRKLIIKNYIAFYRIKNDEIQVVRVLYGMRNFADIL